jgi:peptide/nickel transport system substrate-binding protein
MLASACAAPRAHSKTLRVVMTTEPGTLNPLLQLNDWENFVTRLAFDQLVTVDSDGRTLLPRMAREVPTLANGGISRDGRTITWHLRRDVRWQDGVPFTSRDVAYSFRAILDPRHNVVNRRGFDLVRDVRTPDPYTVVVRLAQPYAPAVTQFFGDGGQYTIVPEHLLAREADFNRAAFNALPVGTGPFRIVRWIRGQEIDLRAFDGYYRGAPHLRSIVIRFVPNEATDVNLMRTHEPDLFTLASTKAYGELRRLPGVRTHLTNIHGATTLTMNVTHGALRDVRVRRAIALAIDKRALVQKISFGAATPASADLPDFMWAHDASLKPIPYDPAAARRLLRDAGFVPGPDGVLVRDGQRLTLTHTFAVTNAAQSLSAIQVQAYLRAVGIDDRLKGYTAQELFAGYGQGGVYQTGRFDLATYEMTLGIDPDSSGRFSCESIPPNGQNYSRYCNPEVDAAERAGLRDQERAARKRDYTIVAKALLRDVPIVFIQYPTNIDAYAPALHGFRPNPITASWNAEDWSL